MNAGWVEPGALPSGRALGVERWDAQPLRKKAISARRLWLACALAALALAAIGFSSLTRRSETLPAATTVPAKDFVPRSDLPALLFVGAIDGGEAATAYEAAMREGDAARRDALTLGDPFSDGPFLRAVVRIGGISPRGSLFFVDMARQAAELGQAVAHAANPQAGQGGAMVSEVTLEADGRQRSCLGFRFAGAAANLSGLACGGVGQPPDRAGLECLISRLEPTAAGAAAGLDKLLNRVSGLRPVC
jgi:hypothetical protein